MLLKSVYYFVSVGGLEPPTLCLIRVYLISDDDGREHRVSSHTRIKKEAHGKFSKFNIPKEPNRKPDYKSILFNKLLHDPRLQ